MSIAKYEKDGLRMTLREWSELSGVPYATLWARMDSGIPFEDCFQKQKGRKKKDRSCPYPDCFNCPHPDCIK